MSETMEEYKSKLENLMSSLDDEIKEKLLIALYIYAREILKD